VGGVIGIALAQLIIRVKGIRQIAVYRATSERLSR